MQSPLKGIRDIIVELNVMTNNKNFLYIYIFLKKVQSDEEHLKK